jgi:hypothetical protein
LVDRICGKSKLGMPMKIAGRERVEERMIVAQGPECEPEEKALISGLDLLPITLMMG